MDGRKIRKFKRICSELAEFIENVHSENENINLFFCGECGTSVMLIDTDGKDIGSDHWRDNQEKCVLASVDIPYSDCGGI